MKKKAGSKSRRRTARPSAMLYIIYAVGSSPGLINCHDRRKPARKGQDLDGARVTLALLGSTTVGTSLVGLVHDRP